VTGRDRASARIRRRAASARYIETHVALWRNSAIENAAGIRDETEAFNVLNDAACEAAEAIPCWLEPVLNWRASRRLDHDEAGRMILIGTRAAATRYAASHEALWRLTAARSPLASTPRLRLAAS
jgi:hypothetical protein